MAAPASDEQFVSRWQVPEVASPAMMARTLATFYVFGGSSGLLAAVASGPGGIARPALVVLSTSALVSAAVAFRWGPRWPRAVFHLPVLAATGLITAAVLVSPSPAVAVMVAALIAYVCVDAFFFFGLPLAWSHMVVALGFVTGALLLQGDVALATAIGLDTTCVALGTVTRGLVVRASSASRDPLTGLRNRRGVDDALQELMRSAERSGEPLSAALLDLDHFKDINDSRGHEAGDAVLRRVADLWQRAIRPDSILARFGGDEFVLLVPGTSGADALQTVRRLCAQHPDVGVSAGVAEHVPGESAAQLMRRADRALYEAKAAGRGRCELDGVGDELPRELAAALAEGALEVHYQPLVVQETGRVFGVEALARWTHPERGPVPPAVFIPVAEQSGMVGMLGEHVLRTSIAGLVELRERTGVQLRLGVNVSVRELSDPTYPQRLAAVLAETGWESEQLTVEVTESLFENDTEQVVSALRAMRDLGIGIAVDDFGTGYSSLSRLDTLPVGHLKLDHSFIASITTSPRRAQLLSSIIALAENLGLGLVAEGVETEEQDALLRSLGCRYAQGWLYGRAVPLAELVEVVGARSAESVSAPVPLG